jgi:hypothetical protein
MDAMTVSALWSGGDGAMVFFETTASQGLANAAVGLGQASG